MDAARLDTALDQERAQLLLERIRFSAPIGIGAYAIFGVIDYLVAPELLWGLVVLRLVVIGGIFGVWALTFTGPGRRAIVPLSVLFLLAPIAGIAVMSAALGGFTSTYHIGILLALFFGGLYIPWRAGPAAILCGLSLGCYFAINLAWHGVHAPGRAVENLLALATTSAFVLFAVVAAERTRRRDLELRMRLERANQELRELDRAKTRFFANVSHELRTPLTLIIQAFRALEREGACGAVHCERGLRNASRLLVLIDELLWLQRLEGRRLELHKEPVDLAVLAREVAGNFDAPGLGRRVQVRGAGGPVVVEADGGQLRTVLYNLLSNAVKFTRGHVDVEVAVSRQAGDAVLEVRDNGVGIAAEDLPRIFERFTQGDETSRRRHEGAGIGLSLVKEIVELHGGRVEVTSEVGVGSRFRIRLPGGDPGAVTAEAGPSDSEHFAVAARPGPGAPAAAPVPTGDAGESRILVAEDNDDLRDYVVQLLGSRYRVDAAADGAVAWRQAQVHPPDLVIADVMMPEMDGEELLARIRGDRRLATTPVVLVTARAGREARATSLRAGADDYLIKPFDEEELLARVDNLLTLRRQERELAALNATLESRVAEQSAQLRRLADNLTSVQETERRRVAHELHDDVGQLLTVLRMESHLLRQRIGAAGEAGVREALDRVDELLGGISERLVRIVSALRPRVLDQGGLGRAIEALAAEIAERAGLEVEAVVAVAADAVDERVGVALYRVTQESLTNIVRHATARRVELSCAEEDGAIALEIADDGCGFDVDAPEFEAGWGLLGIRERVALLGGECRVISAPGEGTRVSVRIPPRGEPTTAAAEPRAAAEGA